MSRLWHTDTRTHTHVKVEQYSAEAESAMKGLWAVFDINSIWAYFNILILNNFVAQILTQWLLSTDKASLILIKFLPKPNSGVSFIEEAMAEIRFSKFTWNHAVFCWWNIVPPGPEALGPSGLLDNVLHALRALRPCEVKVVTVILKLWKTIRLTNSFGPPDRFSQFSYLLP